MASARVLAVGRVLANGRVLATGRAQSTWRQNLFLRSDEFDDAIWIKVGSTVTPNAIANFLPGATGADAMVETAANSLRTFGQNAALIGTISNRAVMTTTVYVKAGTRQWFGIGALGTIFNGTAMFDIVNGAVGNIFPASAAFLAPLASGILPVYGQPGVFKCWATFGVGASVAANTFNTRFGSSAVNATSPATLVYVGTLGNTCCTVFGAQYTVGNGPADDYIHTAGAIVNDGTSRNSAFIL